MGATFRATWQPEISDVPLREQSRRVDKAGSLPFSQQRGPGQRVKDQILLEVPRSTPEPEPRPLHRHHQEQQE